MSCEFDFALCNALITFTQGDAEETAQWPAVPHIGDRISIGGIAGIALGPFEWANDDNGNPVVTIALARDARSVPPQAKAEIGCDRLRGTAIEVSAALRVMAENCAGRMPMQSDLLLIHCRALQRAAGLLPEDDMEFERRQR